MPHGLDVFRRPGRFFRGNLHTHSILSDGAMAPAAVCAHYRDAGYDFLALTDHFLARYGFPVADTRPFRSDSFTTLLGAELHAPANSHGELWHILAVGLPADFPPTGETETGAALARRAADAGAFVAVAHPQWSSLRIVDGRALDAAHAVEIYNNTCALECDRGDGAYLLDALLNEGLDRLAIATDDAHFKMADAGGGWVMVMAEANEPAALLTALKNGHFYASQGPTVHAAEMSSDTLHVECSPAVTIAAVGRGSRAVHASGSEIIRAALPLEKFIGDWFRFVVMDAAGRTAWSNPVRLGP